MTMNELSELTVTLKGEDTNFKKKFALYEEYKLSSEDPVIAKCIKEAMTEANFEPDDVSIRIFLQC
jgi:hypothetical protein